MKCPTQKLTILIVTITAAVALSEVSNDDETATLRVWSENFKMYNINVANTYGSAASSGQALALSAYASVSPASPSPSI